MGLPLRPSPDILADAELHLDRTNELRALFAANSAVHSYLFRRR
jgi:hypothetical protein